MDKAEDENDTKAIDALAAKADALEEQLGLEYERNTDELGQLNPNSEVRRRFQSDRKGVQIIIILRRQSKKVRRSPRGDMRPAPGNGEESICTPFHLTVPKSHRGVRAVATGLIGHPVETRTNNSAM